MSDRTTVTVALRVEISAGVLQEVVKHAKKWKERNQGIGESLDTADVLNRLVSRFLQTRDFERFIRDESI